jgi:hypothetical protein
MAFTQEQIDILKQAIAEGALIVQYGDKRVEYRSLKEMKEILNMMQAEVNASSNIQKPTRIYTYGSKGTD